MAKLLGIVVALLVGGVLAVSVSYATVATQRPDAKAENTKVSDEVTQANGDVSKVVLKYGRR